jgi:hypothetical protein
MQSLFLHKERDFLQSPSRVGNICYFVLLILQYVYVKEVILLN